MERTHHSPPPASAQDHPATGCAKPDIRAAELIERITDGFFALDPAGRFTFVNFPAEQMLERCREDLLGKSVWTVFPEGAGTRVYRKFRRAMSDQEAVHFEQEIPDRDRCFIVRVYPSENGVSVFFRNVTERRRAERSLQEREEQFREIAEHIREVIYVSVPNPREILYLSPTFEQIWGRDREWTEREPLAWTRWIHPEDRERVLTALPRQAEGSYEEVYRIIRPDGEQRWILDRAFPVRSPEGKVYRVVGLAEDITREQELAREREESLAREQEARREAQEAARLREEVLRIVSHDLKNPLHAITLSAGVLRDLTLPEPKRLETLERIQSAVERMERLIGGLLDTARLEAGQGLPVERRATSTAALLKEACALFAPQVGGKRIRLECQTPDACPQVYADADRLMQVFWNLIGNAVKFTPPEGTVRVSVAIEGDQVRFTVEDSGPGIDPEDQGRLFDPFWQAKRTARLGTGLGLPISKAIIEAHDGQIEVVSRSGRGSTFSFTVPTASDSQQSMSTAGP